MTWAKSAHIFIPTNIKRAKLNSLFKNTQHTHAVVDLARDKSQVNATSNTTRLVVMVLNL